MASARHTGQTYFQSLSCTNFRAQFDGAIHRYACSHWSEFSLAALRARSSSREARVALIFCSWPRFFSCSAASVPAPPLGGHAALSTPFLHLLFRSVNGAGPFRCPPYCSSSPSAGDVGESASGESALSAEPSSPPSGIALESSCSKASASASGSPASPPAAFSTSPLASPGSSSLGSPAGASPSPSAGAAASTSMVMATGSKEMLAASS